MAGWWVDLMIGSFFITAKDAKGAKEGKNLFL
jgi:hypothetical protein